MNLFSGLETIAHIPADIRRILDDVHTLVTSGTIVKAAESDSTLSTAIATISMALRTIENDANAVLHGGLAARIKAVLAFPGLLKTTFQEVAPLFHASVIVTAVASDTALTQPFNAVWADLKTLAGDAGALGIDIKL